MPKPDLLSEAEIDLFPLLIRLEAVKIIDTTEILTIMQWSGLTYAL